MGLFKRPKVPTPPPPPNPAITATSAGLFDSAQPNYASAAGSLISTTAQGLKRRASTQRRSLIGG